MAAFIVTASVSRCMKEFSLFFDREGEDVTEKELGKVKVEIGKILETLTEEDDEDASAVFIS